MIKSVKFKEDYELYLEKETQKRFPTRRVVPGKYDREKKPYHLFNLFPKDLTINFREGVNVIVGENGSGKTTLFSLIKNFAGQPFKDVWDVLGTYKDEEDYLARIHEGYNGPLEVSGTLNYQNSVFFNAEEDNPVVAIPKMINPDSKDFVSLTAQLWFANEESHGESMISILDYLLDNAKDITLFFDEPETALSLKNQIRLARKFFWSAKENNNQIIISTHSLAIINQFDYIYDMETRNWVTSKKYVKDVSNTTL